MERFGIVNKDVLTDPEISLTAKGVYALVCTYADKNGWCYPLISTLADVCDVHPRTIQRKLEELMQKGFEK